MNFDAIFLVIFLLSYGHQSLLQTTKITLSIMILAIGWKVQNLPRRQHYLKVLGQSSNSKVLQSVNFPRKAEARR